MTPKRCECRPRPADSAIAGCTICDGSGYRRPRLLVKDCRAGVRVAAPQYGRIGTLTSKAYRRLRTTCVSVHWDGEPAPDCVVWFVKDLERAP